MSSSPRSNGLCFVQFQHRRHLARRRAILVLFIGDHNLATPSSDSRTERINLFEVIDNAHGCQASREGRQLVILDTAQQRRHVQAARSRMTVISQVDQYAHHLFGRSPSNSAGSALLPSGGATVSFEPSIPRCRSSVSISSMVCT